MHRNTALDARVVANRFLDLAFAKGEDLTMMQLIKLTYIAHGWSLALLNAPLIRDKVQAWQHGPVIPSVYHALKKYGSNPISDFIRDPETGAAIRDDVSEQQEAVIDAVYSAYGKLHAFQLSDLTHKKGSPWAEKYDPDERFTEIPNPVIAAYYSELSRNQTEAA